MKRTLNAIAFSVIFMAMTLSDGFVVPNTPKLLSYEETRCGMDVESYDILCRIVEAEATGGNVEQKRNVASCVLARVYSKNWPDTVEGVVFQNNGKVWQFSPISDGRYFKMTISDTTREAVDLTLTEGMTHSCEYFCTKASYEKENSFHRRKLKYYFYDGEHVYCN